jgi:hypothetical protein
MNDKPTRTTASIAVAPVTVTDRTAHLVLGLEPPALRALVSSRGIRHVRVGRRLLVRVDDILEALDTMAIEQGTVGTMAARVQSEACGDETPPWTEEMVIERIRFDCVLHERAKEWLAANGAGASDRVTDPDLRRRVLQMERRDRRRATIDRDRASKGLPPRRWQ